VSLDGDRSDYVSAVRQAATTGSLFGQFFISTPDFEFANFTPEELERILWELALERGAPPDDRGRLREAITEADSGKALFRCAQRAVRALAQIEKGDAWGSALQRFAIANPNRTAPSEPTGPRPFIEAVRFAVRACQVLYHRVHREYQLDASTGQLINRAAGSSELGGRDRSPTEGVE
jgi:hypothetical protein